MEIAELLAISPVDGRYRSKVYKLSDYFSEYALIKNRIKVEIAYFLFLAEKNLFTLEIEQVRKLENYSQSIEEKDIVRVKEIEKTTNHDVKAVEYFLKEKLAEFGAGNVKEWIHFGLTSQDVNNTSVPLSWKAAMQEEWLPAIENVQAKLKQLANEWKDISMLARTHGQPASPTRLGKEMLVFVERIDNQLKLFSQIPYSAKFGGATGNFNAHKVAFPGKDWVKLADEFIQEKLGLERLQHTTQIEHYDNLAAHFDCIKRINNILINLSRDAWTYISMDYFKQAIKKGEVGSSAMPHKVNPIDFENAEGNLGIANALLEHFSAKLPISRLQRDLTDSTVLRNIGVPVAHTLIAVQSLQKGLGKLILNKEKIDEDLENNWAVVAEAIQTILRRENYPEPYEALKALTRNNSTINKKAIQDFIKNLSVSEEVKQELLEITPQNYVGV